MNRGSPDAGDQGDARRVDRKDVDDPVHQVVEDPLDREVGGQGARELAEHVREPILGHVGTPARRIADPQGLGGCDTGNLSRA